MCVCVCACCGGGGGRRSYKNTFFSPFGGLKRLGARGRRGSGEGLRRRAGLGRMRGAAATLATLDVIMALGAFMVGYLIFSRFKGCGSLREVCTQMSASN